MSEDYGEPEMTPDVETAINLAAKRLEYHKLGGRLVQTRSFAHGSTILFGLCLRDGKHFDDAKAKPIIDAARQGDPYAIDLFRKLLPYFKRLGPLPPNLRRLDEELVSGQIVVRKGLSRKIRQRDFAIAETVKFIMTKFKYVAYAKREPNRSRQSPSACWIVKKALEKLQIYIEVSTVEKALQDSQKIHRKLMRGRHKIPLHLGVWLLLRGQPSPDGPDRDVRQCLIKLYPGNTELLPLLHADMKNI